MTKELFATLKAVKELEKEGGHPSNSFLVMNSATFFNLQYHFNSSPIGVMFYGYVDEIPNVFGYRILVEDSSIDVIGLQEKNMLGKCYICKLPLKKSVQKFLKKNGGTSHKCKPYPEEHLPAKSSAAISNDSVYVPSGGMYSTVDTTVYSTGSSESMTYYSINGMTVSVPYGYSVTMSPDDGSGYFKINLTLKSGGATSSEYTFHTHDTGTAYWGSDNGGLISQGPFAEAAPRCTKCNDRGAFFREVKVGRFYESILTNCGCMEIVK